MKTSRAKRFILFLIAAVCTEATAASISGTISYSGSLTGQVSIVALTDTIHEQTPVAVATISSPGSYSITGLSNGTYYIVSIMTNGSEENIKLTDPWGYYGYPDNIAPITISGGVDVSGIDVTMADGTVANPNPFYRATVPPTLTVPLPATIDTGVSASIVSVDSLIYLYKQDYQGASSAKIYKINPSSGEVTETINFSLESLANGICWINKMVVHNGVLWAVGGYGDPSGSGWVNGVFTINFATSRSSNQIPADTGIDLTNELGGLTSDGVNLYVGVTLKGTQPSYGIVKFNPAQVSKIPTSPFFNLGDRPSYLCFGDGYLWAGADSLKKIDPSNGTVLARYNVPSQAAGLYRDNMFWMYDGSDSTLKAFALETTVGVNREKGIPISSFQLFQNYPNPFNPSTQISYRVTSTGRVSLKVFDMLGRGVATLVNEVKSVGAYTATFDASNLPSGVYFYQLKAGNFLQTKKMLLIK